MKPNPTSPKTPPPAASPAAESDRTTPVKDGERAPRLPHEHDESGDSQAASQDHHDVGQQALDDVRAGQVDTDRGPVADSAYQRQKDRSD